MKIETKENLGTFEHVVTIGDAEVVLYQNMEGLPICFGLYIWNLPYENDVQILTQAVEQITGKKVDKLTYQAGNGHGLVKVKYEETGRVV